MALQRGHLQCAGNGRLSPLLLQVLNLQYSSLELLTSSHSVPHRLALIHAGDPVRHDRILSQVQAVFRGDHHEQDELPRDPRQVGVRELVPNQPRPARGLDGLLAERLPLPRQVALQDRGDAVRLLHVALHGAGQSLVMELVEPGRLAVVRSLSAGLKEQPLLRVVPLGRPGREAEPVVRVVLVDQVQQDGARLPQRDARVGVLDRGDPPVRVDRDVVGLFDVAEGDWRDLVGDAEFFEDYRDFGRVGAAFSPDLDGLKLRGS